MSAFVHIFQLIAMENDFETKLDLLTSIGITTTNDEIFKACEEVRNEIDNEIQEVGAKLLCDTRQEQTPTLDSGL